MVVARSQSCDFRDAFRVSPTTPVLSDSAELRSAGTDEMRPSLREWVGCRHAGLILKFMPQTDLTPRTANDPKSVVIHLTTGTGMEIEWKDGHRSVYTFPFLRDACPCALCEDERSKVGRKRGEAAKLAPGALPMFKPAVRALSAEAVGKYALKFSWNDKHDLGIYSWFYLREVCPCAECSAARK
jgi:DUF971 family protein